MKVISLVGARPQFIKEAVLREKFQERNVEEILVHSGQHYDFNMSEIFFRVLKIQRPKYELKVGSGRHGEMTGKIMILFEEVVLKEKPDVIVVYGDTNTTMAGALVGAKLKIPVAHVEAGLRQRPKDMPEEINRVVTDHVSRYLFCPSRLAVENLKREGVELGVHFTGDIMYDLYLKMEENFDYTLIEELGLKLNDYIVCTIHRDFNTDDPAKLKTIIYSIEEISRDLPVVFPVHPRTKKRMAEFGIEINSRGVITIEPVDYLQMMGLISECRLVITDSGGLQKEAYFAGKRALIVMPDTAWKEMVDMGWNRLAEPSEIVRVCSDMLGNGEIAMPKGLYGDGKAGRKMVEILLQDH